MSENPTPLRFPSSPNHRTAAAPDDESRQAVASLARFFRAQLDESAASWEGVSYDLLERAADGVLSSEERLELELALEADPSLQRELDDLLELRRKLSPVSPMAPAAQAPPRVRRFTQVAGFAAAALLLAAVGVDWAFDRSGSGGDSSVYARATASRPAPAPVTPRTAQPVFRDGFETGDASSWQN